ncbi:MAG TPA: Mu P family protein [Kaistia sp.]|nr:Mu P family protein [Kaistia sp.]
MSDVLFGVTTRRVALHFAGQVFDEWTRIEIVRSIDDISGSFSLELRDGVRSISTWPFATLAGLAHRSDLWSEVKLTIDGETVLIGWMDEIDPFAGEGQAFVSCSGRDKTGDLVDCAATVDGPAEYRNVTVLEAAKRICKPFGIAVRADADVGEPFDRVAIDPGETAMSAIEKLARQRALIITSDGVGGLLLTRSGKTRASGTLTFPGNVTESGGAFSARDRYSEYVVKGQAEKAGGARSKTATLDATAEPLTSDQSEAISRQAAREEKGVSIVGRAKDSEVTRYRPIVSLGRTQLTAKGAQTQANWMMRTARARSENLDLSVLDFRSSGALWRPNTLVAVDDSYQDINRDMLISGVTYTADEQGCATRLHLTGPEAYDVEPEEERRRNHRRSRRKSGSSKGATGKLDSTAERLPE